MSEDIIWVAVKAVVRVQFISTAWEVRRMEEVAYERLLRELAVLNNRNKYNKDKKNLAKLLLVYFCEWGDLATPYYYS